MIETITIPPMTHASPSSHGSAVHLRASTTRSSSVERTPARVSSRTTPSSNPRSFSRRGTSASAAETQCSGTQSANMLRRQSNYTATYNPPDVNSKGGGDSRRGSLDTKGSTSSNSGGGEKSHDDEVQERSRERQSSSRHHRSSSTPRTSGRRSSSQLGNRNCSSSTAEGLKKAAAQADMAVNSSNPATERNPQSHSQQSPRHKSSQRKEHRDSHGSRSEKETSGPTEDEIAEYAGKRALARLEAEFDGKGLEGRTDGGSDSGDKKGKKSGGVLDRRKLARVPQVRKSDLVIGEYLGRGNFSDVFEVTWIPQEEEREQHRRNHDRHRRQCQRRGEQRERRGPRGRHFSSSLRSEDESSAYSKDSGSDFDANASNDMLLSFGSSNDLCPISDLGMRRSISQIRTLQATSISKSMKLPTPIHMESLTNSFKSTRDPNVLAMKCLRPAVRAKPRKFVIGAEDLAHETAMLACLDHPNIIQLHGRAAGCFSTAFQSKGGDDEKGRKGGPSEGYFIILDRLVGALTGRMDEWTEECLAINQNVDAEAAAKNEPSPTAGLSSPSRRNKVPDESLPLVQESFLLEHLSKRVKVAYCIADALAYLHFKNVVFRDLKPANVGFDGNDCVKMFDFGFATSIPPQPPKPKRHSGAGKNSKDFEGYGPLTETCGTRRYMAPEVALKLGYGLEVDVYSFGMLLWEICALEKPFSAIQSVDDFHEFVVVNGKRPPLMNDSVWPPSLKELMVLCWSDDPLERPTMLEVKTMLCDVLRDMNMSAIKDEQVQKEDNLPQGGINSLVGKMRRSFRM